MNKKTCSALNTNTPTTLVLELSQRERERARAWIVNNRSQNNRTAQRRIKNNPPKQKNKRRASESDRPNTTATIAIFFAMNVKRIFYQLLDHLSPTFGHSSSNDYFSISSILHQNEKH
jgi:hypothetical protein